MPLDAPPREAELPKIVANLLMERLPSTWQLLDSTAASWSSDQGLDAVFTATAPGGSQVSIVVECKRGLVTRDLFAIREQLADAVRSVAGQSVGLVAAPYLSSSVRAWLEQADLSYVDATGNIRFVSTEPAVYLRDRGADKDPWRGPGRPRGTLKGPPAARVVRALVDYYPPMSMRVIVELSGASIGAAYRVMNFLDQETLVERNTKGEITRVDWPRLLRRWSEDYSFAGDNAVASYLQPRGLPALVKDLPRLEAVMNYVVTGSLAAQLWAPYAPARLATIYVEDTAAAADLLGLRAVDKGANVLLATPSSPAVFARAKRVDCVRYASPSQVVVDLFNGPGRGPSEGQELLMWMEQNEPQWRTGPPG